MYLDTNLMALAIIPGLLLIIYVYKKDKVEKEPVRLIIRLIIFGIISCIVAAGLEQAESAFLPKYPEGSVQNALVQSFLMAALVEETVKYLAMRFGSWRYQGFNYRFDGIVYGVSAAVGFAIYENILYVASYGLATAIVRAFTAVPLHAFCGVFMGVFYSYSKKASLTGQPVFKWTLLALLVPMCIHGVYDTFAFLGERGTMPLLVFVVLLYIAAISTIRKMSKEDYRSGFYTAPAAYASPQTFQQPLQQSPERQQVLHQAQQPVQPQQLQMQQPVQPAQPQMQQPVQPAQPQQPQQSAQLDEDGDIYIEF